MISFVVLFVSSFVLKFFVLFASYMYVVIYVPPRGKTNNVVSEQV